MICSKEASTGEIIASQPIRVWPKSQNVVLYSPDPLSSWRVELKGVRYETIAHSLAIHDPLSIKQG